MGNRLRGNSCCLDLNKFFRLPSMASSCVFKLSFFVMMSALELKCKLSTGRVVTTCSVSELVAELCTVLLEIDTNAGNVCRARNCVFASAHWLGFLSNLRK